MKHVFALLTACTIAEVSVASQAESAEQDAPKPGDGLPDRDLALLPASVVKSPWRQHVPPTSRQGVPGIERTPKGRLWEAWISLKFTGETYGGEGEDLVVCDRVILVKHEL